MKGIAMPTQTKVYSEPKSEIQNEKPLTKLDHHYDGGAGTQSKPKSTTKPDELSGVNPEGISNPRAPVSMVIQPSAKSDTQHPSKQLDPKPKLRMQADGRSPDSDEEQQPAKGSLIAKTPAKEPKRGQEELDADLHNSTMGRGDRSNPLMYEEESTTNYALPDTKPRTATQPKQPETIRAMIRNKPEEPSPASLKNTGPKDINGVSESQVWRDVDVPEYRAGSDASTIKRGHKNSQDSGTEPSNDLPNKYKRLPDPQRLAATQEADVTKDKTSAKPLSNPRTADPKPKEIGKAATRLPNDHVVSRGQSQDPREPSAPKESRTREPTTAERGPQQRDDAGSSAWRTNALEPPKHLQRKPDTASPGQKIQVDDIQVRDSSSPPARERYKRKVRNDMMLSAVPQHQDRSLLAAEFDLIRLKDADDFDNEYLKKKRQELMR